MGRKKQAKQHQKSLNDAANRLEALSTLLRGDLDAMDDDDVAAGVATVLDMVVRELSSVTATVARVSGGCSALVRAKG